MAKSISGINKDKERGTFTVQKQHKNVTIKKRGFATLNEAKAYLANEIYLLDHPEKRENKLDASLNDLFSKYIEYRETNARITTIDGEIRRYKNHIAPELGDLNVSTFTPDAVHKWRIKLVKKQMSDNFTNKVISTLKKTLIYGQTHDYKFNNKCLNELEKAIIKKIPEERAILSYEQIDKFLDSFDKDYPGDYEYWLYFYAFSRSGMRPNEFRALQVKDIRPNGLNVNHDITSKITGKGDILQPCKNDYSVRTVLMPENIMQLINEKVKDYAPNDFIFGKTKALRETNIKRVLDIHLKAVDLPHITIYGFRHSHATHLIRSGVMIKVVSARLGHKDIKTTLNTYQHLLKEDQESVLKYL